MKSESYCFFNASRSKNDKDNQSFPKIVDWARSLSTHFEWQIWCFPIGNAWSNFLRIFTFMKKVRISEKIGKCLFFAKYLYNHVSSSQWCNSSQNSGQILVKTGSYYFFDILETKQTFFVIIARLSVELFISLGVAALRFPIGSIYIYTFFTFFR